MTHAIPTSLSLPPSSCETVIAGHTKSTPSHVLTVPILATVFHQWTRLEFGLGFQRIGMFHIRKTPPPPHEVGRAQHEAQHSLLGPVSGPAVYLFSIRQLLLSPAARVQARQNLRGARFRTQRRAAGLELDITTSYFCSFFASGTSVGIDNSNWLCHAFFPFQATKPKKPGATPDGPSQSRAGHPLGRYATADREGRKGGGARARRVAAEGS